MKLMKLSAIRKNAIIYIPPQHIVMMYGSGRGTTIVTTASSDSNRVLTVSEPLAEVLRQFAEASEGIAAESVAAA